MAMVVGVALLFVYVFTHRVSTGTDTVTTRPPDIVAELDGPSGNGPEGLLVLVGGGSPAVLDTHTGDLTPLPGLPTAPGDRAVLQPVGDGVLATVSSDRASRALLVRRGTAVPLGDVVAAVPTRSGDIALVTQGNGSTTVRLRAPDGALRPPWSVRGLGVPVRDTVGGFLLSRVLTTGSSGGELLLVDARTGAARRTLGTGRVVLAATDRLVAHLPGSCRADCRVTVSDLATGKDRQLPAVSGAPAAGGAFSPDGEMLALSVPGSFDGGESPRGGFVTVLDLVDAQWSVVPGVLTPAAQQAGVDWSPDGRLLVVAVWRSDRGLIGLWSPDRPGDPPVVLRTQPPGDRTSRIATAEA